MTLTALALSAILTWAPSVVPVSADTLPWMTLQELKEKVIGGEPFACPDDQGGLVLYILWEEHTGYTLYTPESGDRFVIGEYANLRLSRVFYGHVVDSEFIVEKVEPAREDMTPCDWLYPIKG